MFLIGNSPNSSGMQGVLWGTVKTTTRGRSIFIGNGVRSVKDYRIFAGENKNLSGMVHFPLNCNYFPTLIFFSTLLELYLIYYTQNFIKMVELFSTELIFPENRILKECS
jgi:hypothetical protein